MKKSNKIVFLTGAGVSTGTCYSYIGGILNGSANCLNTLESGVPAFRGNAGLGGANIWDRFKMEDEQYENFLAHEQSRINYWIMHEELSAICANAKPNPSHDITVFLANYNGTEKEKDSGDKDGGKLLAVLTQNIDGMYQLAGLSEDKVVELHGTSKRVRCMTCSQTYDPSETFERIKKERELKRAERRKQAESEGIPVDEAELEQISVAPHCLVQGTHSTTS